jgi:hypothetical protein
MDPNDLLAQQDDGLIRRTFGLTVKSVNEDERSIDYVFSTNSIDSYDEIVEQDWDLTRYHKNPVVLYNHNRGALFGTPKDSLPIGYAKNVGVVNGRLEGTVCFASESANPFAEQCWKCAKEGVLRAGSVGFDPGDAYAETRDGKDIYRLCKNKLFEFSLTPIGACEDAIAKSAGTRDRELSRIKTMAARHAAPTAPPSSGEGDTVDPEKMKAEIERLTAENKTAIELASSVEKEAADARAKLADISSKHTELQTQHTELQAKFTAQAAELKALTDAKDKLEGESIATEVNALVGKKLIPAQVDDYIELRVTMGSEKFAAFVAKMPDVVYSKDITGASPADATNTATGRKSSASGAVLKAAQEAARKAANKFIGDDA